MTSHDNSYKNLFSHPEMVRDLLVGFVNAPWLDELDLSTLQKASGSYVSDDLRDREDDIVWRVRFKDRWLYLYLLLEFQSTVDHWMPVRVLTYLGLLYQDLIKQGGIARGDKLPPVLPIVLYNGKTRWPVPTQVSALIEQPPGQLQDYLPQFKYLLLDEGTIDESGPLALKNLAAALFRLEKSATPGGMEEMVGALVDWLSAPEQDTLRRAFVMWIKRVLLPGRLPGVALPELGDLLEIKSMLAETVIEWTEQWKREGLDEGKRQGKLEGKLEGEAVILERQLTRKFGPLSDATQSHLRTATLEQLEMWAERILDAQTLSSVFDQH
jgi:predicted transposase YdaD